MGFCYLNNIAIAVDTIIETGIGGGGNDTITGNPYNNVLNGSASADLMAVFYGEYWLDGTIPKPMGSGNRLGVPNQAFATTDGAVIIVANNDDMWRRIAGARAVWSGSIR